MVILSSVKSAISIPDPLFREGEKAAKRLKVSRSELYRRALESFLRILRERDITASYDAAFADKESPEEVEFRRQTTRRALLEVEWKE